MPVQQKDSHHIAMPKPSPDPVMGARGPSPSPSPPPAAGNGSGGAGETAPLLFLAHRPEHLTHLRDYSKRPPSTTPGVSPMLPPASPATDASGSLVPLLLPAAELSPSSTASDVGLRGFLGMLEEDFVRVQSFFNAHERRLEARLAHIQARIHDKQRNAAGLPPLLGAAAAAAAAESKAAQAEPASRNHSSVEADAGYMEEEEDSPPAATHSVPRVRSPHARRADGKGVADSTPSPASAVGFLRASQSSAAPSTVSFTVLPRKSPEAGELIELYHAALLLDNYRLLNATAFLKIAKKFDKHVARHSQALQQQQPLDAKQNQQLHPQSSPHQPGGRPSQIGRRPSMSFLGGGGAADEGANEQPPLSPEEEAALAPLLSQVQSRLALADFFTSTRLDGLMDRMLRLYARVFVGVGHSAGATTTVTTVQEAASAPVDAGDAGLSDDEATALAEAKRVMAFPLPALRAPDVRRTRILWLIVLALVGVFIFLALWVQDLEAELSDARGVAQALCFSKALGGSDSHCAKGSAFPWSLASQLPIFRCVGMYLFHILGWSFTVELLRQHRVNYPYLLDLDSGSVTPPLRIRGYVLRLFVAWLGFFIWQLAVWVHEGKRLVALVEAAGVEGRVLSLDDVSSSTTPWILHTPHVCMVLFFVFVLLNPFNLVMRSGRRWLGRIMWASIRTPFVPLRYSHTWVTNQFTTVSRELTDTAYIICMETWGFASSSGRLTHADAQQCTNHINLYWFWLSTLPSWLRCVQSFRRYLLQDRSPRHYLNGLKYSQRVILTILSSVASMTQTLTDPTVEGYSKLAHDFVYYLWVALTLSNVFVSIWWDVRRDWGLVNVHVELRPAKVVAPLRSQGTASVAPQGKEASPKPTLWARLDPSRIRVSCARLLLLPPNLTFIYLVSMVWDSSCRFVSLSKSWPVSVIWNDSGYNSFTTTTILGVIESGRRNWASFHRLENEHMCNAEKFREMERIPALTPADYRGVAEGDESNATTDGSGDTTYEDRDDAVVLFTSPSPPLPSKEQQQRQSPRQQQGDDGQPAAAQGLLAPDGADVAAGDDEEDEVGHVRIVHLEQSV